MYIYIYIYVYIYIYILYTHIHIYIYIYINRGAPDVRGALAAAIAVDGAHACVRRRVTSARAHAPAWASRCFAGLPFYSTRQSHRV